MEESFSETTQIEAIIKPLSTGDDSTDQTPRKGSQTNEVSPFSSRKNAFIYFLLISITIPMGYLITTNVFTSDFMPFMCVEENQILEIKANKSSEYVFYDDQHFLPNTYMSDQTLSAYINKTTSDKIAKEQCKLRKNQNQNSTTACSMVYYNKPGVLPQQKTLRISYDLICDREWLLPTTTTAGFLGNAIGSLVGGRLSDKYGRKPLYISSLLLQILFVFLTSISPNVWLYIVSIFLAVFCQMISYQVGIVILSELCTDSKQRSILQCVYGLVFSFGVVMLPATAYFFPDWRHIMMIAAGMRLLAIPYGWLIPESWKWQRARQARKDSFALDGLDINDIEATKALKEKKVIEVINKAQEKEKISAQSQEKRQNEVGFVAIFKHPEARRRLILICFVWLLQSYSYYGMNINSTNISHEHIYRNTILTQFVDIPAAFLSMIIVSYFGKRTSFLGSIAGTFCILLLGLTFKNVESLYKNYYQVFEYSMIFGKMLLCNITNLVWMYVQDLFPTDVRNTAVGIAAFFAQLGSCIAPYVVELGRDNPNVIYGSCLVISFFVFMVVLSLPETDKDALPDTLSDIDREVKK